MVNGDSGDHIELRSIPGTGMIGCRVQRSRYNSSGGTLIGSAITAAMIAAGRHHYPR